MSFRTLVKSVQARFKTLITDTYKIPTSFPNMEFDKPEDDLWIEFVIRPGRKYRVDIGAPTSRYRTPGIFIATIRSPIKKGEKAALDVADLICARDVFLSVTAESVTYTVSQADIMGREGKWHVVQVVGEFWKDTLE